MQENSQEVKKSTNVKTKRFCFNLNEKDRKKLKMVLEYYFEPKNSKEEKQAIELLFMENLNRKYKEMLEELNKLK